MKRLAVIIPTYNSSEMIKELFLRSLGVFEKFSWDVFVYDSSEDDKTLELFNQFKEKYNNMEYIRINSEVQSNEKVFRAFLDIKNKKAYEYMWICPDYIHLKEGGAQKLEKRMTEGFDYIVLNYRHNYEICDKVYNDCNELFHDLGWHITAYMASVIRVESFVNDEDLEMLREKYLKNKCKYHSHFGLVFEQIVKLDNFRAVHIPFESYDMSASSIRKTNIWRNDTFYIWAECWPATVRKLPPVYTEKESVIRDLGVKSGIFSKDNFMSMRIENIYNRQIFEKYYEEWPNLTDLRVGYLKKLSNLPPEKVEKKLREPKDVKQVKKKLKKFSGNYDILYIYGCGAVASKYSEYLGQMGIKYEGFIVSDSSKEKESFMCHDVIQINERIINNKDIGIILGLNSYNTKEVLESLEGRIDKKRIFWR
ncbi:glycosyltransferase [Eubacterium xylanophilum]|uniref:glycosyltransferase n=1 Tax=Eubacterium xylanophilum TaxID=39497 RepID=UPI00047AB91D|nr:glycosyltransferase [Eubacterium xylanophilum]